MTAERTHEQGLQHLSITFKKGRKNVNSIRLFLSLDFSGLVFLRDKQGSAKQIPVRGGEYFIKTVNINEECGSFSLVAYQGTGSIVSVNLEENRSQMTPVPLIDLDVF